MLKFIHKQGQDKAKTIESSADEEFKKERNNYIASEKQRITEEFNTRLA
jgi:vacuolar-type H+-ATPase subunit E/Vma4